MRMLPWLAVMLVVGCQATDPYQREGTWRPNHANDDNLRAMVAIPSDLVRGIADDRRASGQDAAAAVDRQRNGTVVALPDSAIAQVSPIHSGTPAAPAAAPATGSAPPAGASQ